MPKTKVRPYPQSLLERMAETSGLILKARTLVALGMPDLAPTAWLAAAAGEEQVAPRCGDARPGPGGGDPSHQCRVLRRARRRVGQGYQPVSGCPGRAASGAHPQGDGATPRGLPRAFRPFCERQRRHAPAMSDQATTRSLRSGARWRRRKEAKDEKRKMSVPDNDNRGLSLSGTDIFIPSLLSAL